ncbi:MAG TPA: hypothetical protein VMS56_08665 [Thermoanaerobaculia bacterium]|nr:hypothetical protein [Thermoanaerobaculia bacterium]
MSSHLDFSGALRRRWWVVLLLVGVALATTVFVTSRQDPVFQSSAMLVVGPSSMMPEASDVVRGLDTLERRTVIATFARIPSTLETREGVAEELEAQVTAVRPYTIRGSVVPSTNIIRIDVEGPDPEMAARVANAAADVTAREARSMYRVFSMRSLARATPTGRPTHPDPQRNLIVGAMIGLFLGIAAVLVIERPGISRGAESERS